MKKSCWLWNYQRIFGDDCYFFQCICHIRDLQSLQEGLIMLSFSCFIFLFSYNCFLCRGDWKKDESTSACLLSANNLYDEDEDSRRLLAGYTTTSKGTRKIFFLKLEAKKEGSFSQQWGKEIFVLSRKDSQENHGSATLSDWVPVRPD